MNATNIQTQLDPYYILSSVTHLDGSPRIDGRYPRRVGSTVKIVPPLALGISMRLAYISDASGKEKKGYLTTSRIQEVELNPTNSAANIKVKTMNSVYFLTRCLSELDAAEQAPPLCGFDSHSG